MEIYFNFQVDKLLPVLFEFTDSIKNNYNWSFKMFYLKLFKTNTTLILNYVFRFKRYMASREFWTFAFLKWYNDKTWS